MTPPHPLLPHPSPSLRDAYLLPFGEDPVLEAPGDGGGGVPRGLAGQRDELVELGGRLVLQVGDLRRD